MGEFEYEDGDELDRRADLVDEDEDTEMLEGELVLEGGDEEEEEDDSWDMQLAKVYDRTIVELGDSLEAPNLGVITEGRAGSSGARNVFGILHE